jgi:hypothetical protein
VLDVGGTIIPDEADVQAIEGAEPAFERVTGAEPWGDSGIDSGDDSDVLVWGGANVQLIGAQPGGAPDGGARVLVLLRRGRCRSSGW